MSARYILLIYKKSQVRVRLDLIYANIKLDFRFDKQNKSGQFAVKKNSEKL